MKLKNKKKKQAGFTLIEVLVATIVMLLAVGVIYNGIDVAVRRYADNNQVLSATNLANNLELIIKDELRFGKYVEVKNQIVYYYSMSDTYGEGCYFTLNENKHLVIKNAAEMEFELLGASMYDNNYIDNLQISYNVIEKRFNVTFSIMANNQEIEKVKFSFVSVY